MNIASKLNWTILFLVAWIAAPAFSQVNKSEVGQGLPFPGLLAKEQRETGNPLATLDAMRKLESRYLASKVFGKFTRK